MKLETLLKALVAARYKIFVAVRPIGPAREAYSMLIAELCSNVDADTASQIRNHAGLAADQERILMDATDQKG